MFCFNHFKAEGDFLLAICDESILGETFREDGVVLDVKETFYCKEKVEEDILKDFFKKATIINAVGKDVIELLTKEGLVDEDKILKVEGVPHAQVVKVE